MIHQFRLASALTLALTLTAASPALARLDEQGAQAGTTATSGTSQSANLCSEVCSAAGYTNTPTGAKLPHDPRARSVALAGDSSAGATLPHDPRARAVALGSATATSAPAPPVASEVVTGGGYRNPSAPVTVIRVSHPAGGFDWGDAGIGAGGMLALTVLLAAGTLGALSIRRRGAGAAAQVNEPEQAMQLTH